MQVKKLDISFYAANTHLINALDLVNGQWFTGKARGYGIIILSINNHTFAVPLRSSIKHRASFPTVGQHGATHKGMDFSKALLITQQSYISNDVFKIPPDEHSKIKVRRTTFKVDSKNTSTGTLELQLQMMPTC